MFSPAMTALSPQINFGQKTRKVDADTLKASVERILNADGEDAAVNYLTIQFNQGNPNTSALGESYSGLISKAAARSNQVQATRRR